MDVALVSARAVLAVVFFAAAASKAMDWARWRAAVREFGPTRVAAPAVAVLVPVIEVAVAAATASSRFAWWAAVGAVGLVGIFSAAVAKALRNGRAPDCRCFGRLTGGPVGTRTIARNAVIAVPAVVVVAFGRHDPGPSLTSLRSDAVAAVAFGLLVTLIVVGFWFLVQLVRQHGRLLLRIEALEAGGPVASEPPSPSDRARFGHGPMVGDLVPDLVLGDLDDRAVSLRESLQLGRPVLVVFADPGCGPCSTLIPQLARRAAEHGDRVALALVSAESTSAVRRAWGDAEVRALVDSDHAASTVFAVTGTPAAVLVDGSGHVVSSLASGAAAVSALLNDALRADAGEARSTAKVTVLP